MEVVADSAVASFSRSEYLVVIGKQLQFQSNFL